MADIYQYSIGLSIILDTSASISSASVVRLYYEKPSGTTGYWSASAASTTKIIYTTTGSAEIDEAGDWEIQGYVDNDTFVGYSDKVTMPVKKVIA